MSKSAHIILNRVTALRRRARHALVLWVAVAALVVMLLSAGAEEAIVTPEMTLEQLIAVKVSTVYGASKRWQDVAQSPSPVSIVTSEEIKLYGHRNLAEALRSVPGLYVSYDRNYNSLGIRGFNRNDVNTRVLVMVDGHRMNDAVQDIALIGNDFLLDVDLIDRVEVIRGPGSSLYGNNAFFGVINVITRRGQQLHGAEISGEAGGFDTYKGRFSYGRQLESGLEILLSGTYSHSGGQDKLFYKEFDSPENNSGVASRVDDEEYYSVYSSASWRGLTLAGGYNQRNKTVPTASYNTVFNSPQNLTTDARAFADLRYQTVFADESELTVRAYYDQVRYDGDFLYDVPVVPPPQLVLNLDRITGQQAGAEVQWNRRLWERLRLTLGAEVVDKFLLDQRNYNLAPRSVLLDDHHEQITWGVYGQAEVQLLTNLTFHAGLRYDWFERLGDRLNPRLALVYSPLESTTLRALYGSAFRAPSAGELYYNDGRLTTKASPDLRPETIDTYQLSLEQKLPADVRLSLAGFYYHTDDLITSAIDPADGLLHFVNLVELEALGAEVALEKNWSSGLRVRASYNYQDVTALSWGRWLNNSPRHLARLNVAVPLLAEKIFAGAEIQYASPSLTLAGKQSDEYWVANLTLYSQKLVRGLEVSASLYNVFDQKFGYPGGSEHRQDVIAQDGRSFRVKLTWRF